MKKRIVIIGAGFGGLAAANLLAKAGHQVSIYESHAAPGGRAGELIDQGYRFDTGPSWFLMPDVYEQYFALLGKKITDYVTLDRLDPAYKVFFEQQPALTIGADVEANKHVFETIEPGAGSALEKYLEESKSTYSIALDNFLYDNLSYSNLLQPATIKLAPKLLPAVLSSMDGYVSRFFSDRRLRQILEYPAVFLGSSPFTTPSLYRLMSHLDFTQGVFFPRGGMYELVKAMVKVGNELGVDYHYNAPVSQIVTDQAIATGIKLIDGTEVRADLVISNADLHHTETALLPVDLQTYPEKFWRKKEAAPSALLLYLGIKGKLPELEHHNLFFIDQWAENFKTIFDDHSWPNPASMYVSKTTATDPTAAPDGHENIFVLVPGPSGESGGVDFEQLANTYIDQIATMSGISDFAKRLVYKKIYQPSDFQSDYHAWQNTALGLSHVLRQSAFMRPGISSKKVDNLYYVGANTAPGIGLPMCLIGAELVYKKIHNITTKGRLGSIG